MLVIVLALTALLATADLTQQFERDVRVLASDRMEGSPVLLKAPGKTKGLSNIPWHQDCGMGGHAVYCPSALVGLWLTGSSAETGNLKVVPGSQGRPLRHGHERRTVRR